MILSRVCLFVAGAAAAAVVREASKSESLHNGAVRLAAAGLRAADVVSAATQTIADEAADINAEARRQARIDAAVKERLADLEEGIRAEVTAEVDGTEVDE
ncbi:MAG: DUF1490 domain-containing protein [Atopobiaceae bacterium]|jgi:hypothetical protein|nr:DUF1490 domain-containing protein [Atopobiaceae bacterium]